MEMFAADERQNDASDVKNMLHGELVLAFFFPGLIALTIRGSPR